MRILPVSADSTVVEFPHDIQLYGYTIPAGCACEAVWALEWVQAGMFTCSTAARVTWRGGGRGVRGHTQLSSVGLDPRAAATSAFWTRQKLWRST